MQGCQNPLTVTMDGDKTITATFKERPSTEYMLSTSTVGYGTMAKARDQAAYAASESVTLTARPDAGWVFSSWSGGAGVVRTRWSKSWTAIRTSLRRLLQNQPMEASVVRSGITLTATA